MYHSMLFRIACLNALVFSVNAITAVEGTAVCWINRRRVSDANAVEMEMRCVICICRVHFRAFSML